MDRKLFIFDMGEVLVLGVKNLQAIARHFSLDYAPFRADYGLYDKPLMEGWMDSMDFFRHMEKRYSLPPIRENLFYTLFSPRTNIALIPHIRSLRLSGHRCVLGSNTFAPHIRRVEELEEKPLDELDARYESYLMHDSKPSPSFWRTIMEEEGFSASDTVFVDDRRDNIEAAAALGITTLLYSAEENDRASSFFSAYL